MEFILIIGPQAVGKMTVGLELEKMMDAKLLFNHQTIDLFAEYLNYTPKTFELSELVRKELFKAFVENHETNTTNSLIFTAVVAFDLESDWEIITHWISIFTEAEATVSIIELESDIEERLKRNTHEQRLTAKPSKRNLDFSKQELLTTFENHRLNSDENEVQERLPDVNYLRINNTTMTAEDTAKQIHNWLKNHKV